MKVTLNSLSVEVESEEDMLRLLRFLRKLLSGLFSDKTPPPKPGRVSLAKKEQLPMASFKVYFDLPAPRVTDVAKRNLRTVANGGEPVITEQPGDALISTPVVFQVNDAVVADLQDIDTSGNVGEFSEPFAFVVTDTVAPPAPGRIGVSKVEQID